MGFGRALQNIGMSGAAQNIPQYINMAMQYDQYQTQKKALEFQQQQMKTAFDEENKLLPFDPEMDNLGVDPAIREMVRKKAESRGFLDSTGPIAAIKRRHLKELQAELKGDLEFKTQAIQTMIGVKQKQYEEARQELSDLQFKNPGVKPEENPKMQQAMQRAQMLYQELQTLVDANAMTSQEYQKQRAQQLAGNERKDLNQTELDFIRQRADELVRKGELKPEEVYGWVTKEKASLAGQQTGARVDAAYEARARNAEVIVNEVKRREQAKLDVKFNPDNLAKDAARLQAEATAKAKGQPLTESTQQVLQQAQALKAATNELRERFTPQQRQDFVGYIKNPKNRALQYVEGDPEFAEFQAIMGRIKASAFGDAGKNFTATEMQYVTQYIPQGNEPSWQDFEAKLMYADRATQFIIDERTKLATMTRGELADKGLSEPRYGSGAKDPSSMSDEDLLKALGAK